MGNRGYKQVDVTETGNGPGADMGAPMQDGDTRFGVGSRYQAVLVERENKSINRNNSVVGPQANNGKLPQVGVASRNTGRVTG